MKLYLTVLLLLVASGLTYRYLANEHLKLPQTPNAIYYLANNLLVTQTGKNITVYNTETDALVQNFTADSDTPTIQVAPESNMLLFTNNKSIFQLQEANQPEVVDLPTEEINWVFGLGAIEDALITHSISSKGTLKHVTYIDANN